MKQSLRGHKLPQSAEDFAQLKEHGEAQHECCTGSCGKPFTEENVLTPLGWQETQITGICEECWGRMFPDEDEENGY